MKFFKENYSGEAYDKAEKKAADVEKTVEQTEGILRLNRESALEHSDRLSDLKDDATKARSRVEKLKGEAGTEAIALDKQHKDFQARAKEATKALEAFEREKLGIHRKDEEDNKFEAT